MYHFEIYSALNIIQEFSECRTLINIQVAVNRLTLAWEDSEDNIIPKSIQTYYITLLCYNVTSPREVVYTWRGVITLLILTKQ